MQKILTISLNPALDSAAEVETVVADIKLRCVNISLEPGGGGVNVSRAVALLGGESTAFVALAAATGNMMAELLAKDGINLLRFDGPGMTRQSTAITETSTGKQFRFGQPGPNWSAQDAERALQAIKARLMPKMLVVASGSLPPDMPTDFYVQLGHVVQAAGAEMIVDTSGAAQHALMGAGPGLMKVLRMNQNESEHLAGKSLQSLGDAAEFAQSIAQQELAELVIMARGEDGSVFATREGRFHCVAPHKAPVVSKVGAGDSFVGGLVYGLAQGLGYEAAGKLATAAAAAAVTTSGTQLCPPDLVAQLLPETTLTVL